MNQIVKIAFMSWVPAFLMRAQHIEENRAGMILGVIGLLCIVGVPLGGFLADLWQKNDTKGRMYLAAVAPISLIFTLIRGVTGW